ncbi:MAG TPA: hypothetical protein VKF14_17215 [Candidatus Dormibacteraeota bacterium]|nr:hypothetical protein [Candidatus Dormibacteraeota bacterium]
MGSAPVAIDHGARMTVFAAILLTVLLSALDQTVVGTALPRIVADPQGTDRYVWVSGIAQVLRRVHPP